MPDTRQYDAGSPGVGKTHICVGLGIRAVEQGFSVQYFRFDELMTALKIDAGLPPARLKRRKYMSTALLLIDELGFEPMTRPEASLFFRLVKYRYGRGAILITTNKSVRDWTELLAGDEVLAAAILDRLLHICQATPRFTKYGDTRFTRGTASSRAGRADRTSLRALGSDVRPA